MHSENTSDGVLESWSADEVACAFNENEIVLIDVRTPQEYLLESIPGSLLMPMATFDPHKLPSGSDKGIVLICGSGKRSDKLARRLLGAGHRTARHLEGGFGSWKNARKLYQTVDLPTGEPRTLNDETSV